MSNLMSSARETLTRSVFKKRLVRSRSDVETLGGKVDLHGLETDATESPECGIPSKTGSSEGPNLDVRDFAHVCKTRDKSEGGNAEVIEHELDPRSRSIYSVLRPVRTCISSMARRLAKR